MFFESKTNESSSYHSLFDVFGTRTLSVLRRTTHQFRSSFSGIKIYGICTNLQWNLMQLVSKINAERKWKCSWRRCPIVARILYFLHLLKGQAKVIDVIITVLIVIIIHVISVNRFVSMWKDICAMVAFIFLNGGIFFWADFLNREICCVFSRHFLIAKKKKSAMKKSQYLPNEKVKKK